MPKTMESFPHNVAQRYFYYLAEHFPVMCASDEFHFFPRVQAAQRYFDKLDSLDAAELDCCLAVLQNFLREVTALKNAEQGLENLIDLEMLQGSIAGLLMEFGRIESWRHNPLLYLKIAFIGLDQALSKPATSRKETVRRLLARLNAIPRLFQQAEENINRVPEIYLQAASAMIADGRAYLFEISQNFVSTDRSLLSSKLVGTLAALERFARFLASVSQGGIASSETIPVAERLKDNFLSPRSLEEVFEIAEREWADSLAELNRLRTEIDPDKSWQTLYHAWSDKDVHDVGTIPLYQQEADHLHHFFRTQGFCPEESESLLEICETPIYLRSVRSAASFCAAFTVDPREKSFFYITTQLPSDNEGEASKALAKRLHREYKFLCAHETIPGHQLLDSIRRRLDNPVRSQIESPLFYEGWAYYAESLLTEYGYVRAPMERLVDQKRRLWRAARCQIDVGLASGRLSEHSAVELLVGTGLTLEESTRQLQRFKLNPGYQLCYTLGRYEIERLKRMHASRIGVAQFHQCLLYGGQMPFHLVDKRLAAMPAAES